MTLLRLPPGETLDALTQTVLLHHDQLLGPYQPADLHQFRVHIRRIRALMKIVPALKHRELRGAWRALFVETNPARDWDVLLETAQTLLGEEAAAPVKTALLAGAERRRAQALNMLRSSAWKAQTAAWNAYLQHMAGTPLDIPASLLPLALERAHIAHRQAAESTDDADWHRYRIAIKNVRYLADFMLTGLPGDTRLTALVEECKSIQDLLGTWHDCSVQEAILESEEVEKALAGTPSARESVGQLAADIAALRRRQWSEIQTAGVIAAESQPDV